MYYYNIYEFKLIFNDQMFILMPYFFNYIIYFNIKLIKIKITIKLFYCECIIILTFRKHHIMNYNI